MPGEQSFHLLLHVCEVLPLALLPFFAVALFRHRSAALVGVTQHGDVHALPRNVHALHVRDVFLGDAADSDDSDPDSVAHPFLLVPCQLAIGSASC